jgi:hypothetical protein
MNQKSRGEKAVEERKAALLETQDRMDVIRDKLVTIREQVSDRI